MADQPGETRDRGIEEEELEASFLPTLPGNARRQTRTSVSADAFDELLQSWLEEDPAAPWHQGPAQQADRLTGPGQREEPSSSMRPAPSTGLSGPQGMPSLALGAAASLALRPNSAPASTQRGMVTRRRSRLGEEASASMSDSQQPEVDESESSGFFERGTAKAKSLAKRGVDAVRKPVGTLVDDIKGGVKRTFKRSKTAEERAERIKERNRRAQKAFRDRQKALSMERSTSFQLLEANLSQLQSEKEDLAARVRDLEAHLEQDTASGIALGMDACPFWMTVDDDHPVEISADDVKAMDLAAMSNLYKLYVEALQQLLREAGSPVDVAVVERVAALLEELSALKISSCSLNPLVFAEFQASNLAEGKEQQPPEGHWAHVLEAVGLTEEQIVAVLAYRQDFLTKLSPIVKQRWEIHHALMASFGSLFRENPSSADVSNAYRLVQQASAALVRNLREEQAHRMAALSFRQQSLFSPLQKAVKITASWPWYPDCLAMTNTLAILRGAPSARALLGIENMPPNQQP